MAIRTKKPSARMTLTHRISEPVAAALGRMIATHSYLEFQLSSCLYKLAGVSHQIGRIAIANPRGKEILERMQQLCDAKGFDTSAFPWGTFKNTLEELKAKRDQFAHSPWLYNKNVRKYILVLTSGNRPKIPASKESTSRKVRPEGVAIIASDVRSLRVKIETAIAQTIFLDLMIQSRLIDPKSTWPNRLP